MAIIKKRETERERAQIDTTGPDGNAYALLAYAKTFGEQLGWSHEDIQGLQDEMKSSDYQNLLAVFDREFGSVVDLIV